ncbi:MAG: MMPL family transporter [Gammaproteobacteria bacterium]|nr:MMPL family transporter [Gammaproteobacteria bacterium]
MAWQPTGQSYAQTAVRLAVTNARLMAIMAALVAFTLALVMLLVNAVSMNDSATIEQMLAPQDQAQLEAHRAAFGWASDPILIAINTPALVDPERLPLLEQALRDLPFVAATLSSTEWAGKGITPAMRISLPAGSGLLVVFLHGGSSQLQQAKAVAAQIEDTVNAHLGAQASALIVGVPQIRVASWQVSRTDMFTVLPLLLLGTVLVTWVFFKGLTAVLLALLLTSLTTATCLLLQFTLTSQLSTLMVVAIPVIWAIATLDAFHLFSRAALRSRQRHPQPVEAACAEIWRPCLLTTITTAACFLTLTVLDTSPLIVSLGAWGAVGACIAFVLTFTLGRWILLQHRFATRQSRWPARVCYSMVCYSEQHRRLVIGAWALCVFAAVLLFPRLHIASVFPQVFSADTPIARDIVAMQRVTDTDLTPIELMIVADDAHGAQPQRLASAALLTSHYLTTLVETRLVLPIALLDAAALSRLADTLAGGSAADVTHAQLGGVLAHWFNSQRAAARVQWHAAPMPLYRKQQLLDWIAHFDATMLEHHSIGLSGAGFAYPVTEQRGARSLATSSVLSLLIVGLTLLWITRSGLAAIVALCGSVAPAMVLAGCMAALGWPWSVALLALPVVLLGLMNDDTIHMVWSSRLRRTAKRASLPEGVTSPVRSGQGHRVQHYHAQRRYRHNAIVAGPALLATTWVLAAAVATLMLTSIRTNQYLGLLIPLGLWLAFVANLTLLPALSACLRRSTRLPR